MMHDEMRLAHLATILANLLLGTALMGGGALVAKRSIASASWAAIAGFGVVSADVLRSTVFIVSIRHGIEPFYTNALISLAEAVTSLGALIAAVRALPPRAS